MIRLKLLFALCGLASGFGAASAQDVTDIVEKAKNSTVYLSVEWIENQTGAIQTEHLSGFIVSDDGLIVTAAHGFIRWAAQAHVSTDKREKQIRGSVGSIHAQQHQIEVLYPKVADLAKQNPEDPSEDSDDFAILKIKGGEKGAFKQVDICGIRKKRPGDRLIAVGFPLGREFNNDVTTYANDDAPGSRWVINGAGIEAGMSGGPLFDGKGRVVAIIKGGSEKFERVALVGGQKDVTLSVPVASLKTATQLILAKSELERRQITIKNCEELDVESVGVTEKDLVNIAQKQNNLDPALQRKLDQVSSELKLPTEELKKFFSQGQNADQKFIDGLITFVGRYREGIEIQGTDRDDPMMKKLRDDSAAAIKSKDYASADKLLSEAEDIDVRAADKAGYIRDARLLSAAKRRAERGRVATLQKRYREAAMHFAAARNHVPEWYPKDQENYRAQEISVLWLFSEPKGDQEGLKRIIERYMEVVQNPKRSVVEISSAWVGIGRAYRLLGEGQEGKSDFLEQAVKAHRNALELYGPNPNEDYKYQLGESLLVAGFREKKLVYLKESLQIARNLAKSADKFKEPARWASTQNEVCWVQAHLGRVERSKTTLTEAVSICREALKNLDKASYTWAATQDSLAVALWYLAELEPGVDKLNEARVAIESALPMVPAQSERTQAALKKHLDGVKLLIAQRTRVRSQ